MIMLAGSIAVTAGTAWAQEAIAPAAQPASFYRFTTHEAQEAIARALEQKGAGQRVDVKLIGKTGILYSHDHPLSSEVKTLSFDAEKKTWEANLLITADNEVQTAMALQGRYEKQVAVPVLKQRMKEGDTITDVDLDTEWLNESKLRRGMVLDAESLLGKTPRRTISAHRPIREEELQSPSSLMKGSIVQMRYHSGAMHLSTSGEALDDGAVGDIIRVRNQKSGIIVRARVESDSSVTVLGQTAEPSKKRENRYEKRN